MNRDAKTKTWREDSGGYLLHDETCCTGETSLCTCGLINHLMPLGNPQKHMPDFWEQCAEHDAVVEIIRSLPERD